MIANIPKSSPPPPLPSLPAAAVPDSPNSRAIVPDFRDARAVAGSADTRSPRKQTPEEIERAKAREREAKILKNIQALMAGKKLANGTPADSLQGQCKRRRETYCNQGDAAIANADNDRAWRQYQQADRIYQDSVRSGRPVTGPKPRPPNAPRP